MKSARGLLLLLALVFCGVAATAAKPIDIRLKHGDDPRWAAPDWDDRDWTSIHPAAMPARTGIYWIRVRLGPDYVDPRSHDPYARITLTWPSDQDGDGLFVVSVFAFDLFWDGELLYRGGKVGRNAEEEQPGMLKHLVRIPDRLRGGKEHVLALRLSSYHYNFPSASNFAMTIAPVELVKFQTRYDRMPIAPLMLAAGALMLAVATAVMFQYTDRRRSLILCIALCVVLAVFYLLVAAGYLHNHPYVWLAPRYITIAALAAVISVLLPWLLAEHFSVLRQGQWLWVLAPMLVAAWLSGGRYEWRALWMCRSMLLVSAGILAIAAWRGARGARWLVAVPLAGIPLVRSWAALFLDPTFFIFLEVFVFFVIASVGVQVRAERHRARELALVAARLETELLKRNIQPHFLLNTLATIVEMIEQAPKSAVALIEALADEFRILARVSGEKLIPLEQELALCRSHLNIMSLRKGIHCTLAVEGADPTASVPPALFHTLVENGLTHLRVARGEQRFTLRGRTGERQTRYELSVDGVTTGASSVANTGTGTRYIKARLEESFPGRWRLSAGPTATGWCTVIEIFASPADATEAATASPSSSV